MRSKNPAMSPAPTMPKAFRQRSHICFRPKCAILKSAGRLSVMQGPPIWGHYQFPNLKNEEMLRRTLHRSHRCHCCCSIRLKYGSGDHQASTTAASTLQLMKSQVLGFKEARARPGMAGPGMARLCNTTQNKTKQNGRNQKAAFVSASNHSKCYSIVLGEHMGSKHPVMNL